LIFKGLFLKPLRKGTMAHQYVSPAFQTDAALVEQEHTQALLERLARIDARVERSRDAKCIAIAPACAACPESSLEITVAEIAELAKLDVPMTDWAPARLRAFGSSTGWPPIRTRWPFSHADTHRNRRRARGHVGIDLA
jgi:hypothetical protein